MSRSAHRQVLRYRTSHAQIAQDGGRNAQSGGKHLSNDEDLMVLVPIHHSPARYRQQRIISQLLLGLAMISVPDSESFQADYYPPGSHLNLTILHFLCSRRSSDQGDHLAHNSDVRLSEQSIHGHRSSYMPGWSALQSLPLASNVTEWYETDSRAAHAENAIEDEWDQISYDSGHSHQFIFPERIASPFTSHFLTEENNRLTIKTGLVKIYHDSMEGALSCWLTERNCPYSAAAFDSTNVWGANWANRIVTRVCDLDRAYSMTGSVSARGQKQATKVLNAVVMAFASQWSQSGESSDVHAERSPSSDHNSGNLPDLGADDFGRSMQTTLWHQASKALFEASENMSFRVILAGIIFSLTQRPMDSVHMQSCGSTQSADLTLLFKILDHDGPPIALDIALRKLQDHQRRFADDENASSGGLRTSSARFQLSGAHKQTFGLLYWLAVMFDTLSAAVNRRQFAVSDIDSASIYTDTETTTQLYTVSDIDRIVIDDSSSSAVPSSGVDLWGTYFLHQHSRTGDVRKQYVRWPCSYTDAASCLADAAPVKVLLFRRVAQLQKLFYSPRSAVAVESGIEETMAVYDHWNSSYGRFIDDCIRHHEDLPARIQSWYILLAGHWSLAVFILADLIEKLDTAGKTMPSNRCSRQSVNIVGTLRAGSAFTVSELGRCSRRTEDDLSFAKSPDFHHAVNKAALLTEPWTMVLVRSFGYAGAFWAKRAAPEYGFMYCDMESCMAKERLHHCIDALSLLGRKSDMARCAAQVLQRATWKGDTP
ncbi:hypothetical protein LTR56_021661 [Elasticomyces elasticus]|nr:hypothetical protein LTR56_021661 [Elasticomyces elasticus]KAK4920346.1 hypothetical protein LTR49_012128 [Elasticomyces elasticus]KAK5759042.1 hypothetical protein LTS12_010814 [Elasticomyces elasticus]